MGGEVSPAHPLRRESRLTWLGRMVPKQPFAAPAWGAETDEGQRALGRSALLNG